MNKTNAPQSNSINIEDIVQPLQTQATGNLTEVNDEGEEVQEQQEQSQEPQEPEENQLNSFWYISFGGDEEEIE